MADIHEFVGMLPLGDGREVWVDNVSSAMKPGLPRTSGILPAYRFGSTARPGSSFVKKPEEWLPENQKEDMGLQQNIKDGMDKSS